MQKKSSVSLAAPFICTLAALFYLYEFTLQVSPGVMTHELMRDLGLNAASLGLVSGFYYYAYTPMQIPAGLLHDRFGPRIVLTLAILACSLGALFFAASHTLMGAALGRILMGAGSAFSFTGVLVLIARWFPPMYFAVLAGMVQLMSSIGAIGGEQPLAVAIHRWGWRNSMTGLACTGVLLGIAVWLIVRNWPPNAETTHLSKNNETRSGKSKTNHLKTVLKNPGTLWIACYSFLIWAPVTAFAGLWGIPFLKIASHLTTESASQACAAIWIGIGLGSPLSGWLSEKLQLRSPILTACSLLGFTSSIMILYDPLSLPALYFFLFILGLAGSGQSLAFCVVKDINPATAIGTAIGINNLATVAGGAILQPLIGWLLWLHWDGTLLNHAPTYNVANYRSALILVPLCYLLAAIISHWLIKETKCRQLDLLLSDEIESEPTTEKAFS